VKASQQTLQGDKGKELLDMVCLYPGDESQAVKLAGAGDIVSVSEMTVNYNMSLGTTHTQLK
jgi:translation elongation factor EF-G